MKNKIYSHIPAIMFGVLVISFLAVFYVLAWTEPSVAPPGGNVPVPLNVSINAQSKEGALVVGTNSAVTTGLIVQNGNVGIGTTSPSQKLDVAGNIAVPVGSIGIGTSSLTSTTPSNPPKLEVVDGHIALKDTVGDKYWWMRMNSSGQQLVIGNGTNTDDANIKFRWKENGSIFGQWENISSGTNYQATADGFVLCTGSAISVSIAGYTDGSNPPATMRIRTSISPAAGEIHSFTMPVRKGDYWRAENCNLSLYWMPVGTGN